MLNTLLTYKHWFLLPFAMLWVLQRIKNVVPPWFSYSFHQCYHFWDLCPILQVLMVLQLSFAMHDFEWNTEFIFPNFMKYGSSSLGWNLDRFVFSAKFTLDLKYVTKLDSVSCFKTYLSVDLTVLRELSCLNLVHVGIFIKMSTLLSVTFVLWWCLTSLKIYILCFPLPGMLY